MKKKAKVYTKPKKRINNQERSPHKKNVSEFLSTIQNDSELSKEYNELFNELEECRSEIKAKTLIKFKAQKSPSKIDINIGIVFLYFM